MTERTCARCGETFQHPRVRGRAPSYCSPECGSRAGKNAGGKKPDTPCSVCGKLLYTSATSLPPDRITCRPCRRAASAIRPPDDKRRHMVTCAHCQREFIGRYDSKYCTIACSAESNRRRPPQATCAWCATTFTPAKSRIKFCSKACAHSRLKVTHSDIPWVSCLHCRQWYVARNRRTAHTDRCRKKLSPPKPVPVSSITCVVCEAQFSYKGSGRRPVTCSEACRRKRIRENKKGNPSYRATRRRSNARRRARMRGATVEVFDHIEVFERDRWVCHICRRRTNPTAVAPHPDSPTLDHVVPLAKGGDHTRANTACAHFLCNSRKGDRVVVPEQLRLVG